MIGWLSAKIASHLSETAAIAKEDEELYSYGFFVMLSKLLFLLIATVFGLTLHVTAESIVFFVLFCLIRAYAGGVHAPTETSCTMLTTTAIFLCVLGIRVAREYNLSVTAAGIMLLLSLICVIALSPLDSEEKPLSRDEKRRYRFISWGIAAGITAVAVVFYLLEMDTFSFACVVSLMLESVLLIAGKIKAAVMKRTRRTN